VLCCRGFGSLVQRHLSTVRKAFRDGGVPFLSMEPIDGPVGAELLARVEADLGDLNFMTRFQEGLVYIADFVTPTFNGRLWSG